MEPVDFFPMPLTVSQYTLNKSKIRPYIERIRKLAVQKGSFALQYSESVKEDGELKACSILSTKQSRQVSADSFQLQDVIQPLSSPVGIDFSMKQALLAVVSPVIEDDPKSFWNNLSMKMD